MRRLKSKRGVAIESALIFMMVIFFLCLSVTTVVLAGHKRVDRAEDALLERVALEQIGEDFRTHVRMTGGSVGFTASNAKYTYEVQGNTLTVKQDNNVVLFVEVNGNGAILQWRYTEAE